MTTDSTDKLWGGRFTEATDAFVEAFTASVDFDQRLAQHDIQGSIAHAKMLAKIGILNQTELDDILKGLDNILIDISREIGRASWRERV